VPLSALVLTLAAAALHALWNLLIARAADAEAATAAALLASVVVFTPVAALTWDVDARAAPWIAGSAVLELAYFGLLAAAYRRSELGLVYPLSRGLAPVLVLAGATVALGADPSVVQAAGVLLVASGVVLVRGARGPGDLPGTLFALALAACIAGYTLVDDEGVTHAAPLPYLWLVLVGPALAYPLIVARARRTEVLRRESVPVGAVAGIAMFAAYALVLAALERSPAAPVAAVRESSVVLAALPAALVLGEPFRLDRIAGSVLVACGVALIALA
jgi:drug/metabolite transporter (DMT)-like permease